MEIKPCPFCGSVEFNVVHDLVMPDMIYYSFVECKTDDCCRGPAAYWFTDKAEAELAAIDAYNSRIEQPSEADRWLKEATDQRARAELAEMQRDELSEALEQAKRMLAYAGKLQ